MITRENFYDIEKYSENHFNKIKVFSKCRNLLNDKNFLAAKHSCLLGEKGIGKTVLVSQYALKSSFDKILYVSLDDTFFASFTMWDIAQIAAENNYELLIFDEIHKYHKWKEDQKKICDNLKIKTIISGSSILSFNNLGGLARRVMKYELLGMGIREYLKIAYDIDIKSISLEDIVNNKLLLSKSIKDKIEIHTQKPLRTVIEEYFKRGYYIYSLEQENIDIFFNLLRQSTEDTLAYEIVLGQQHSRADMPRKLQSIFKAISKNVPYIVDYNKLKEYAGIKDIRTLKHYLSSLEQVGIIRFIEKETIKSHRKPYKLYLGNTCFYYAYADLNPNIGSLRETFFINSLVLASLDVISYSKQADFKVNKYIFEVGGPSKDNKQIKTEKNAFLVKDIYDLEKNPRVIPLWLFGFLV